MEYLKGMNPCPTTGYKGDYPVLGKVPFRVTDEEGKTRTRYKFYQRTLHETEKFISLVGVQCMDGGKYAEEIRAGEMDNDALKEKWEECQNRHVDFGTTGKNNIPYFFDFIVHSCHYYQVSFCCLQVAVSIHLISTDGKWMLWGKDEEGNPAVDWKTEDYLKNFLTADYTRYLEFPVACIFAKGDICMYHSQQSSADINCCINEVYLWPWYFSAFHLTRALRSASGHLNKGYYTEGMNSDDEGRSSHRTRHKPRRFTPDPSADDAGAQGTKKKKKANESSSSSSSDDEPPPYKDPPSKRVKVMKKNEERDARRRSMMGSDARNDFSEVGTDGTMYSSGNIL